MASVEPGTQAVGMSTVNAGMIGGGGFECHGFILRIPVKMSFLLAVSCGQVACDSRGFSKGFGCLGCGIGTVDTQAVPVSVLQVSFPCPPSFSATVAYRS